jgi:hypothetical protein
MDPREPIAVPVLAKDPKKPEDGKPEKEPPRGGFMQKKPKKKTDLMDMDIKRKKEEADFSPLVETAIPEAVSLAKVGCSEGSGSWVFSGREHSRGCRAPVCSREAMPQCREPLPPASADVACREAMPSPPPRWSVLLLKSSGLLAT